MESTSRSHRWLWGAAVGFHLLVGVMPYLGTGLLAPPIAVAGLWTVWLVGAVVVWRLRASPGLAFWVPVVALVVWLAVVTVGDVVLGWTA